MILLSHLCVGGTEMVNSTDIDLACRIFGQVISDVIFDIIYTPVATKSYSSDWVHSYMVKQSNCYSISNILKHFLGKGRTLAVIVHLGSWVSDWCLFLNRTLVLYQFWCQRVDSTPIVIVALKSVTVSNSCCSLKGNS